MKSIFLVTAWFTASLTTLLLSLWSYVMLSGVNQSQALLRQQAQVLGASAEAGPNLAYAALPNVVSELTTAITTQDARPVIIENYLTRYGSPMVGNGEYIVQKAEELGSLYRTDPTYLAYLTIAIAQNESNLGKVMPPQCYNAWGYGIHSKGTLCFGSWREGIDKFMSGVAAEFIAKRGLETPEEIMTRYTPQSPNGAWAKGVNQFLNNLYTGKL